MSFVRRLTSYVHDVVDTFWGVPVHDPYRWMEESDDPKVVEVYLGRDAGARATAASSASDAVSKEVS